MKKLVIAALFAVVLAGCEWEGPPGFDYDFHYDAKTDFAELDDDTAEGERPDRDDLGNMKRNFRAADTPEEKQYVTLMEQLLVENENIINDYDYSTEKYEDIREDIGDLLDIIVYEFEFTEEDE